MWLMGLAIALNLVGLLVVVRALFLLHAERAIEDGRALSGRGSGLAAMLLGGLLLMGSGQYQALALLYPPPQDRFAADLDPIAKAGVICGVALAAIGAVLARLRQRASRDVSIPGAAGAPRATGVVLVALLALVGLNVYQYIRHAQLADPSRAIGSQAKPTALQTAGEKAKADREVVRAYSHLFHDQVFAPGPPRPKWFGVETLQNPNDAWIQQEIIHAVKPDFIIETGTYHGGSALLWAMILREVNPRGRVLTVDVDDMSAEAREMPLWKERIDFFLGSSTDPKIVDEITKRVSGGRVLVILDALHTADHVLQELKMYSPLVSVGSYICVQDTYIDHPPAFHPGQGAGPYTGVEKFLAENDRFVIDDSRARFLSTFNPKGQLKRVK
jgi:cephalosporin hydroxylase